MNTNVPYCQEKIKQPTFYQNLYFRRGGVGGGFFLCTVDHTLN